MKAKIKKDLLILESENKKDFGKLYKFAKRNGAEAVVPKSVKKFAYFRFINVHILIR